jgi:hypothetical protein
MCCLSFRFFRKREIECSSLTGLRLDPDFAAVASDNTLANSKTDAGAGDALAVQLLKTPKICSWYSGAIPMPLSFTAMRQSPFCRSADT